MITPLPRLNTLDNRELDELERLLKKQSGLSLIRALRHTLVEASRKTANELKLSPEQLMDRLSVGDQGALQALIEQTVIGESYFFRHPEQFAALQEIIKRDWSDEISLRIWCAGCSTGEEPYSIAAMLTSLGRSYSDRVLATDISDRAIAKARAGLYRDWSRRNLTPEREQSLFEAKDTGTGEPEQQVRRVSHLNRHKVEFLRHNLLSLESGAAPPIADCHIVFCRNVLIYFSPETAAAVVAALASALRPGGLLVLSPVEFPLAQHLGLETVTEGNARFLMRPTSAALGMGIGQHLASRSSSGQHQGVAGKPTPTPHAAKGRPGQTGGTPAPRPAAPAPPMLPNQPALPGRQTQGSKPQDPRSIYESAREAARAGRLAEAERLAKHCIGTDFLPECQQLLAIVAEGRGDLLAAVSALERAVSLDPTFATALASLVALYGRLGMRDHAARARERALAVLSTMSEELQLRGVESMTAGTLRRALQRQKPQ